MNTTTGTTLASYLEWLASEADGKMFGEVGIYFTIQQGQIVDVRKTSVDTDHYPLTREDGSRPPYRPGRR